MYLLLNYVHRDPYMVHVNCRLAVGPLCSRRKDREENEDEAIIYTSNLIYIYIYKLIYIFHNVGLPSPYQNEFIITLL